MSNRHRLKQHECGIFNEKIVCNVDATIRQYPIKGINIPKNAEITYKRKSKCGDKIGISKPKSSLTMYAVYNNIGQFPQGEFVPQTLCDMVKKDISEIKGDKKSQYSIIMPHCVDFNQCRNRTMQRTKNISDQIVGRQRLLKF